MSEVGIEEEEQILFGAQNSPFFPSSSNGTAKGSSDSGTSSNSPKNIGPSSSSDVKGTKQSTPPVGRNHSTEPSRTRYTPAMNRPGPEGEWLPSPLPPLIYTRERLFQVRNAMGHEISPPADLPLYKDYEMGWSPFYATAGDISSNEFSAPIGRTGSFGQNPNGPFNLAQSSSSRFAPRDSPGMDRLSGRPGSNQRGREGSWLKDRDVPGQMGGQFQGGPDQRGRDQFGNSARDPRFTSFADSFARNDRVKGDISRARSREIRSGGSGFMDEHDASDPMSSPIRRAFSSSQAGTQQQQQQLRRPPGLPSNARLANALPNERNQSDFRGDSYTDRERDRRFRREQRERERDAETFSNLPPSDMFGAMPTARIPRPNAPGKPTSLQTTTSISDAPFGTINFIDSLFATNNEKPIADNFSWSDIVSYSSDDKTPISEDSEGADDENSVSSKAFRRWFSHSSSEERQTTTTSDPNANRELNQQQMDMISMLMKQKSEPQDESPAVAEPAQKIPETEKVTKMPEIAAEPPKKPEKSQPPVSPARSEPSIEATTAAVASVAISKPVAATSPARESVTTRIEPAPVSISSAPPPAKTSVEPSAPTISPVKEPALVTSAPDGNVGPKEPKESKFGPNKSFSKEPELGPSAASPGPMKPRKNSLLNLLHEQTPTYNATSQPSAERNITVADLFQSVSGLSNTMPPPPLPSHRFLTEDTLLSRHMNPTMPHMQPHAPPQDYEEPESTQFIASLLQKPQQQFNMNDFFANVPQYPPNQQFMAETGNHQSPAPNHQLPHEPRPFANRTQHRPHKQAILDLQSGPPGPDGHFMGAPPAQMPHMLHNYPNAHPQSPHFPPPSPSFVAADQRHGPPHVQMGYPQGQQPFFGGNSPMADPNAMGNGLERWFSGAVFQTAGPMPPLPQHVKMMSLEEIERQNLASKQM